MQIAETRELIYPDGTDRDTEFLGQLLDTGRRVVDKPTPEHPRAAAGRAAGQERGEGVDGIHDRRGIRDLAPARNGVTDTLNSPPFSRHTAGRRAHR